MSLVKKLPKDLEDARALIKRRDKAASRKEMWRDYYRECYEYTMPQRETFTWHAPGQRKNLHLYDSTGQEATYLAANNGQSLLCPSWKHWASLVPGGDIPEDQAEDVDIINILQETTETVFHYLNHSNFSVVIPEVMLDLMIGTGSLTIDEGDMENPFVFDATPLSILELEEGPNGMIETTFMRRCPLARNLVRMYKGMKTEDLPAKTREKVLKKPDEEVPILQCLVYHPETKKYFGIVIDQECSEILWRFDYEESSPQIVARASVVTGEIYGRGRVMLALPDIKTLNVMQEYVLRHSALQVAPPMTGVSDGVLNPYTAQIIPNSVIPVASNDNGNPSLRVLDVGGNFMVTAEIMENLRQGVRRMLLGAQRSEGAVKSATEIAIEDRNRLWDMGAEYGRIQAELLSKVIARCVFILRKQGKVPPLRIDGKQVTLKYVSPLARAQDQEDLIALDQCMAIATNAAASAGPAGQAAIAMGFKLENLPAWLAKRTGLDASLIRTEKEKKQLADNLNAAAQQQNEQQGGAPPSGGNVVPMRQRAA